MLTQYYKKLAFAQILSTVALELLIRSIRHRRCRMNSQITTAILVAAGRGTRARESSGFGSGTDIAKQWREVAGAPVIAHTMQCFESHPQVDRLVVVLHPDEVTRALPGTADTVVAGGADRAASVRAGLAAAAGSDCVLIHDAARPCVSAELISRVIDALDTCPAAAPALAVTDALWTGDNNRVTGTQSRAGLFRAQTPQGFHYAAITAAHASFTGTAADDVEVARAAGLEVAIVPGDEDNLKITLPADFDRAARILERS